IALLAFLETSSGQAGEAIVDFRRHLAIAPDDPSTLNNLAFLLADTGGSLDEALNLIGKAKARLPNNPGIDDTLGWIYVKKNMNDSAIQVLGRLVNKYPGKAEFRYHLGVALLQKGDKQKAKVEFETALAKVPSKEIADKIKEAI